MNKQDEYRRWLKSLKGIPKSDCKSHCISIVISKAQRAWIFTITMSWLSILSAIKLADLSSIVNNYIYYDRTMKNKACALLFFFARVLTLSRRVVRTTDPSWGQLWRPISLKRVTIRTSRSFFLKVDLNFLQKKVALRPPFPFAMPRGARRRSETYELVFF